jgi:hypothetical protein
MKRHDEKPRQRVRAGLRIAVAFFAAFAACMPLAAAPTLDEYGAWPQAWGRKTGFFGIEKVRDRWWFVAPSGNVFLSKSVDFINLAPDERPEQVRDRLLEWGFNTVGPSCPEAIRGGGLAYTVLLNLSKPTIEAGAAVPGRNFPDVFDPRFERIANEIAGNICPLHDNDPWLLGYFTDDGLDWRADGPGDLINGFLAMPAAAPGKQALVAEIKRIYADDVKRFNTAWGLELGSLDELSKMTELKPGPRFQGFAVSRDRSALLALIAGRYFDVASAAIRSHDANHLILGCRFPEPPGPNVLAAMRGKMDVVSVTGTEIDARVLTQMYADSGLPLMVTPLVVSCAPGAVSTSSPMGGPASPAAGAAPDRAPRGAGGPTAATDPSADRYDARVDELEHEAFVVGCAWPRYADAKTSQASDAPGLVNTRGDVYPPRVSRVEKSNSRFSLQAPLARLKPTLFEIVKRYEIRRAGVQGIKVDGDLKDWACGVPMELRASAYESNGSKIEGVAYLMWDSGALYFAGRLYDPFVEASTVTSYVGGDWIELGAGPYQFFVTLMPGNQTVTDKRGRTKPASLVIGRVYEHSAGAETERAGRGRIAGYTFEGQVNVSGPIPEGFILQFGLALHHYTTGGREVRLSFPYYWSPANPDSGANAIIAGPAPE